jgi:hypothetical protein
MFDRGAFAAQLPLLSGAAPKLAGALETRRLGHSIWMSGNVPKFTDFRPLRNEPEDHLVMGTD